MTRTKAKRLLSLWTVRHTRFQKKEHITYAEVVTLAYPDYPQHPEITYSVTYTRGHGDKPEGTLAPGGNVKVKEGMSFRVNRTGQS